MNTKCANCAQNWLKMCPEYVSKAPKFHPPFASGAAAGKKEDGQNLPFFSLHIQHQIKLVAFPFG